MLALRAESAATALALSVPEELVLPTENPEKPDTVPATALVIWVPPMVPPVELT
jgi:hypothetical protein